MFPRSVLFLCALLTLLLPLQVRSQDGLDLADALGGDDVVTPTPKAPAAPAAPAGGAGGAGDELSLDDLFDVAATTSKAPPKVVPKAPASTKAPAKPKPGSVPSAGDFDLADALDPNNDIGKDKDKKREQGGGISDDDLLDVGKDETYKPDKGKGGSKRPSDQDHIDQYDDNTETTAEVGTIAGIVSAVAMALVGAVSSYISYQKKKFCFSMQQSLNAEMVKSENPDAVVATEPQVQQTLLESANAEPPSEENAV